jgi:insecticidal toxin complex protein TccC
MSSIIHRHTPTLNVVDGRNLRVREVSYLRSDPLAQPEARVIRHSHAINGQVVAHYSHPGTPHHKRADSTQTSSLSGALLMTDSTDAGWQLTFFGESGQALEKWDAGGSHWQTDYDEQLRPLVIYEATDGNASRTVERFTFADGSTEHAKNNQCGRLVRHDDPAGKLLFPAYDLTGNPVSEIRWLLKESHAADWPQELDKRDDLLENGDGYATTRQFAPTGEILEHRDASGHTQRSRFDVAGQLKKITLQLNDVSDQQLILDQLKYNAQGQIESQTFARNILTTATYTPENGRMQQQKTSRSGSVTLQTLHYAYDAVGNVLSVEDPTKAEQYNTNQRVKPISTYAYDSLYQLVQATGREEQGAGIRASLPDGSLTPGDRSRLLNFTQRYTYDERGNLIKLQHQRANNNHTHEMRIAPGSNRGLSWKTGDPLPDFANGFDANGNLKALQTGQPLEWNARNQLQRVTLIERDDGDSDTETYLYDGAGQRVRKRQTTRRHSVTEISDVIYLPGLEIRESTGERLEVITLQAGGCSVRYLSWTRGQPTSANMSPLRFSFNDHLGSNTLETDIDGHLIREEGYYPYGGTAWRTARSEQEVKYSTVRYSGQERDASGLYYFGMRYYAPWLQRWISPDPAGTVDGLNLYGMVGNNPVRFVDIQGLGKDDIVNDFARQGRERSQTIMNFAMTPRAYTGSQTKQREKREADIRQNPDHRFSKGLLKDHLVAHSYAVLPNQNTTFMDFFNLTAPKAGPVGYEGVDKDYQGTASSNEFYMNYGSFRIANSADYLTGLTARYSDAKADPIRPVSIAELKAEPTLSRTLSQSHELQPYTRDLIAKHIENSQQIIPLRAGGPGAHSEVRLLNSVVAMYPGSAERQLSDLHLFSDTLTVGENPLPFVACHNCSGIIPDEITIATQRAVRNYEGFNTHVQWLRGRES